MSFLAGAITGTIELETAQYDQAIQRAGQEAQNFKSQFQQLDSAVSQHSSHAAGEVDSIGSHLRDAFRAIVQSKDDFIQAIEEMVGELKGAHAAYVALAAVAAGLVYSIYEVVKGSKDLISTVGEAQKKMHEMALDAGIGTDQLSRFAFAMQLGGGSAEDAGEAFKFLGKNVYDAVHGNQNAIDTFNRFGIAFQDASGAARPLADVMLDVSDAIANAAPGAERTGAAMALMSARSTGMIAVLSQGSSALRQQMNLADEFGVTVSEAAGKTAHEFDVLHQEINAVWEGMKNTFTTRIELAIMPAMEEFVNFLRSHHEEILRIADDIAKAAEIAAKLIVHALEMIADAMDNRVGHALAGMVAGFAAFGPVGALGGLIGGAENYDAPLNVVRGASTTVNVQPLNSSASQLQILRRIQHGFRQQQKTFDDRLAVEGSRMDIKYGL